MTYDEDACMGMQLNELYTLSHRIWHLIDDIGRLRETMKGWGFDARPGLRSESFMMPKLVQYEADLRYFQEGVEASIEARRREEE